MSLSPDLEDYIDLFESQPIWVDDGGWYYGAEFWLKQGSDELQITIAPDEAELDLVWTQHGRRRLVLSLKLVLDWQIDKRETSTQLIVRVNTGPRAFCGFDYCLVRIRPQIEVDCRMSWGPGWETGSNPTFATAQPSGD